MSVKLAIFFFFLKRTSAFIPKSLNVKSYKIFLEFLFCIILKPMNIFNQHTHLPLFKVLHIKLMNYTGLVNLEYLFTETEVTSTEQLVKLQFITALEQHIKLNSFLIYWQNGENNE